MKERHIEPAEIRSTLQMPDKVEDRGETKRFIKCVSREKVLVVAAKPYKDGLLVITAFRSSQVKRYLPGNQDA